MLSALRDQPLEPNYHGIEALARRERCRRERCFLAYCIENLMVDIGLIDWRKIVLELKKWKELKECFLLSS